MVISDVPANETDAGDPTHLLDRDAIYEDDEGVATAELTTKVAAAYANARFAFCPWGDTLTRKSIFDALMHGSIPVFFEQSAVEQYAPLGPIANMSVVVPLSVVTPLGVGALSYLRSLPAERVSALHDNVVRYRRQFHMPDSVDSHIPGDAVDNIVSRIATQFQFYSRTKKR